MYLQSAFELCLNRVQFSFFCVQIPYILYLYIVYIFRFFNINEIFPEWSIYLINVYENLALAV